MLEVTHAKSLYQYRICPTDSCTVEHRPNKSGARWTFYLRRETAKEAKDALLKLKEDAQQ